MKWGPDQRLAFIETRLYWEGQINRKDLEDFFGLSTPQASNDLKRYLGEAPQNMYYDRNHKTYRITEHFQPRFISTDPQEYFFMLELSQQQFFRSQVFLGYHPRFYLLPFPQRIIDPHKLKTILGVMRGKLALEIRYQSMTDPEPHWRWITPHAFGYDGFRWHVRCFCHKRKVFRDFLLSRILETGDRRPHPIDPQCDIIWNTDLVLRLAPNPELSPAQIAAIRIEYDISDELRFPVKAAFLYYIRRYLELDSPRYRDLVWLNKAEIEQKLDDLHQQQLARELTFIKTE